MEREITKDYMYLIVKNGNKIKTVEEKIEYNYKVESMMNNIIKNKKGNFTEKDIDEFITKVKAYYPNFFDDKSYAIRYNSSYEKLGFSKKCSIDDFEKEVYNYIYANALESLYKRYEKDSSIIAYSHRKRGWKIFCWDLDEIFKVQVATNFAYGASSYFNMILYWKELPIINYLHIIFYRFSNMYDIQKVTESYYLSPKQWKTCFDNTVYYVNTYYYSGADNFIKKYLDNIFIQLIKGLEVNLNINLFSVLSNDEINELFIKENYFSKIYLYREFGPNILKSNVSLNSEQILEIYNNDTKLREIVQKVNYADSEDIEYVLEKFIVNYKNKPILAKKAMIYIFMVDLLNVSKIDSNNGVVSSIFEWLYNNFKADNDYDDFKMLYLIEDEYDLQIKRSKQCHLTIQALNNTKDNEMKYIYNLHKNKLVNLISILKNQNNKLLVTLKLELEKIEKENLKKTIEKNKAFKVLEKKQSYKNNLIFEEYFSVLKDYLKKLIIYENDDIYIQSDINNQMLEKLNELKSKANSFSFNLDNIANLSDFGLENKIYYIYYDNHYYLSFNKKDVLNKYLENKNENEKKVLCSIVSIPKNIHQIMKDMLQTTNYTTITQIINKQLVYDIFRDIEIITKYYKIKNLTNEQITITLKNFVDIYISSFKINSFSYKENLNNYNDDSKPYNDLINEISKLTSSLKTIQTKINQLEEYNTKLKL